MSEDVLGKIDDCVICHFAALIILYSIGTGSPEGEHIVK